MRLKKLLQDDKEWESPFFKKLSLSDFKEGKGWLVARSQKYAE